MKYKYSNALFTRGARASAAAACTRSASASPAAAAAAAAASRRAASSSAAPCCAAAAAAAAAARPASRAATASRCSAASCPARDSASAPAAAACKRAPRPALPAARDCLGCALYQSSWEGKRRPCDGATRCMVFARAEARGAPAARPGRRGARRRPAPRAPAAAPRWPARAPPPPATGAPCMWAFTPERAPPALTRFAPTWAYHAARSRTTHVMASQLAGRSPAPIARASAAWACSRTHAAGTMA